MPHGREEFRPIITATIIVMVLAEFENGFASNIMHYLRSSLRCVDQDTSCTGHAASGEMACAGGYTGWYEPQIDGCPMHSGKTSLNRRRIYNTAESALNFIGEGSSSATTGLDEVIFGVSHSKPQ